MFRSSSTSSQTPPSAPNRQERQKCWTTRDAYFACLDKNGVQVPGDDPQGKGVCGSEKREYESACGRSWIDYFNKRRILELRQKATVEAAARTRDRNAANVGR